MEQRQYPALSETVYWDKLPNGLSVAVVPRPGFTKKLAYFVTDFGAIHTKFSLNGKEYTVPDGIAHYLEHKMFDMPQRDVMAEFAAMGAFPNAFTSYDMTAYHFTCTDRFEDCLRLLLEYVSTPYFTQESVDKEQGIIGQEIGMHADNPDAAVFETLMEAMYQRHPIRVPILGTKQTIARITPELLTACHQAFYRPGNMLLCVIGDVDPEQVRQIALEQLPEADHAQVSRPDRWEEEMTCRCPLTKKHMEVAMPTFQLGFKCQPADAGAEAVRAEVVGDLAAEALFGESSGLYLELYEKGLIDSSFGGGYESISGMALLTASGDSNDPEAVRDAIIARAKELASTGIKQEDFLRMKRSALGRRIKDLDSFDAVAFRICAYHFSKYDYFRFPEIYRDVQPEELSQFLQQAVTPDRCSLSIIYPREV